MPKTKEINLELETYALQREIVTDPARFKVFSGGRRVGKTEGGVVSIVLEALDWDPEKDGDSVLWWLNPWREGCEKGFGLVSRIAAPIIVHQTTERGHMQHWFMGGAKLRYRPTFEKPDLLRGEKVKAAVIDEAPQHTNYAWRHVIYPALLDCEAKVYIIGSPTDDPENWFYDLYLKGLGPNELGIKSWSYPTWVNPYLWRRTIRKPKLAEELFGPGHTHVPWYVWHAKEMMGDAAFDLEIAAKRGLTSSDYFQAPSLTEMLKQCKPPASVEKTSSGHTYSVWEPPVDGAYYVMGADASEGVPGGDWSVGEVFRRASADELVQVAEFREHLLPDTFGDVLHDIAVRYNCAKVAVERNHPGFSTILRILRRGYMNLALAWDMVADAPKKPPFTAGDYGWHTDKKSKPIMFSEARTWLRRKAVILTSVGLIKECLALREGPDGRIFLGGRPGSRLTKSISPDRIMAFVLAVQAHVHTPIPARAQLETPQARADRLMKEGVKKRLHAAAGWPQEVEAPYGP